MATCPKCGAPRPQGAGECPECGIIYARAEQLAAKKAAEEQLKQQTVAAEQKGRAQQPQPSATSAKLTNCPACNRQVSVNATSCPHCGEPLGNTPTATRPDANKGDGRDATKSKTAGGIGCAVVVVLFVVYALFSGGNETEKTVANSGILPGNTFTVGDTTFGCRTLDDFRSVAEIGRSGDMEAFKKAMRAGVTAGRCASLRPGATAYIEDTNFMDNAVKVRIQGETVSYWIGRKAVKE